MKRTTTFCVFLILISLQISAQGYLHTDGKNIVNGSGENIILRGIGTGNWMIQEGYMMKSSDIANTQHEFEQKLKETIGEEKTDSFYNAWLAYHFTRTDVDSMKTWGFNSIRPALHYKWFTPPVEDEPVAGEITWIDKGFIMIDSLLDWCSDNEMYLILDMHGTPGGQGKNASISDYDPTKPSLWESEENQDKLIALWKKLAGRYSDEPWIGGYDLINETNWDFENSGNENGCNCSQNIPLRELFEKMIDSIRLVDQHHIIFIEGNCWANNYNGLNSLASYDDNLVFSFHKYWNYNDQGSVQWMIDKRNSLNIPIWLGESGENSNTWFTNAIRLCEENNIGWSWWPVKKNGLNNVLMSEANQDYLDLIDYWEGTASQPTEEEAFEAVLQWAENHKNENCIVKYDVIDAMIRQPHTTETRPFKVHSAGTYIFATDYDLGRNNYAYFDSDTANYRTSTGTYSDWNIGYNYRNDGVDIEECQDNDSTNGFNVGWITDNEWMNYTINTDSTAAYKLEIRYASLSGGGMIHFEANNLPVTSPISVPGTGGWQNWSTLTVNGVIIPAGNPTIKLVVDKEGMNLNYFRFSDPAVTSSVEFKALSAETSVDGNTVFLYLNKDITSGVNDIQTSDFNIAVNEENRSISSFEIDTNTQILKIIPEEPVFYGEEISISYSGSSIRNESEWLTTFNNMSVINNLDSRYILPGRIQAEDFDYNNGFELEECQDAGGGYNTAYANAGDYLDYLVYVPVGDLYTIRLRVSTLRTNTEIILQSDAGGEFSSLDTIKITTTGGWQNWQTQYSSLTLEPGRYTFRILVKQGEYNLNWFEIIEYTAVNRVKTKSYVKLYPNPAQDSIQLEFAEHTPDRINLLLYNSLGEIVLREDRVMNQLIKIDTSALVNGIYFLRLSEGEKIIGLTNIVINR